MCSNYLNKNIRHNQVNHDVFTGALHMYDFQAKKHGKKNSVCEYIKNNEKMKSLFSQAPRNIYQYSGSRYDHYYDLTYSSNYYYGVYPSFFLRKKRYIGNYDMSNHTRIWENMYTGITLKRRDFYPMKMPQYMLSTQNGQITFFGPFNYHLELEEN